MDELPVPTAVRVAAPNGGKPPLSYLPSTKDRSSLDITQRLEEKLAQYNASQNVFKRWLFEIICWLTSAICMSTIIIICIYSKDQPLSSWPLALAINNALSKVASAALILPISEAIGQLKWAWFSGSQSKDMIDFEIFDKASRGAWGSFLLLFRTKGRSLAALGAILTLLMLATDAFFQQVTDLPVRWALQGHGEIPKVVRYVGNYGNIYQDGMPMSTTDKNLEHVTMKYFYYGGTQPVMFGNGTRADIPLSCPSSRCEWESYDTLGVCSACADVSSLLTFACLTTKLDWVSSTYWNATKWSTGTACGYWLNATSSKPTLMSGYRTDSESNVSAKGEALLLRMLPLNTPVSSMIPFSSIPPYDGSIHFKDIYFPLIDALIVSAADGTASSVYNHTPPVAQECMLSWCVKTIESSYALGNYVETVTDSHLNLTGRQQPYPWEAFWQKTQGDDGVFTMLHTNISISIARPNSTPTTYGISNETFAQTAFLFEDIFPSSITVANLTAPPWWRIKQVQWRFSQLREVIDSPWLAPNNVTQYLDKLAISLTNVIRSQPDHEFVTGKAYTQVTYIAVHLAWLAFPLALLAFCLAFLVATMIKTSKNDQGMPGMWKTSAMPTLIYGLPHDMRKGMENPSAWKDNKNKAKVKIRLLPDHGWRVSGQLCTSPTVVRRNNNRAPPGWI